MDYCLLVYSAHFFILLEGEATGRLLRYDPPTKTTHVVLDGLAFPNGVHEYIKIMSEWYI